MKQLVWTDRHSFLAVAHAESVERARTLLLAEIGPSDGSCPAIDAARKNIADTAPSIWYGDNVEFVLTDSAEVEIRDRMLAEKQSRIRELEAELRKERESWTDPDTGIVWTRPTAWAYRQTCAALYECKERSK